MERALRSPPISGSANGICIELDRAMSGGVVLAVQLNEAGYSTTYFNCIYYIHIEDGSHSLLT